MGGTISDKNTRVITTIPKELKEKAEYVAEHENRSLSNLMYTLLSRYVNEHYSRYVMDDFFHKQKVPSGFTCKEVRDKEGRVIVHGYLIPLTSPVFKNGDKEFLTEEDVRINVEWNNEALKDGE